MSETTEKPAFQPAPKEEWTMLFQGAEAKVWKLSANQGSVEWICKERFSKSYRHPDLDQRLTKSRCRSEARVLEKCAAKQSDLRVPKVIRVDAPLLYIEYIPGPSLKSHLNDPSKGKTVDLDQLADKMGTMVGQLHNLGIIHGDLTTSNLIWVQATDAMELVLIDFGLAKSTSSVEEQAVDLYVLERAIQSTHPDIPENFMDKVISAYSKIANKQSEKKSQQTTLQRLEQVRLRGRKRECFG